MYKGNMYDFAERALAYTQAKYGIKLHFAKSNVYPSHSYIVPERDIPSYPDHYLPNDSEDFEERVYAIINDILKEEGYI